MRGSPGQLLFFLFHSSPLFLRTEPGEGLGGGWQVGQGCPTAHHPPAPHHPLPHLHHQPPELGSGPIQPPSCCWVLPAPVPATLLCPGAGDPRQGRGRGWPQWVSVPRGRLLSPPGPALCGAAWLLPWLGSQPRLQQQGGRRAHMVLRVLAKTQLGSGSSRQICKELKAAPSGVFSSEAPQSVAPL